MENGDMIQFGYVYNGCRLNNKLAIYLGDDAIQRNDGVVIYNFKVLVVGSSAPTWCDRSMYKHIRKVEA